MKRIVEPEEHKKNDSGQAGTVFPFIEKVYWLKFF